MNRSTDKNKVMLIAPLPPNCTISGKTKAAFESSSFWVMGIYE
jgi:hypothetical protein